MTQLNTVDICDAFFDSSLEYGVAVSTDRALPDALNGLKPVHKRILYSMYKEGRFFNKAHVKCAKIVGDVMGDFHPHGDSSIYEALVRLAQEWVMRYPLIDWHGNKGNRQGDGAAAMRYTESRLAKIAEDGMLAGLDKNNVPMSRNYDNTLDEPVTLPSIFPNLLCNPNDGIAYGMACSWLPHNLCEVAEAIYAVMRGEEPMLPGPDFPTGGVILNAKDIPAIMKTGHGTIRYRAKYEIKKNEIIFYDLPYGKNIEDLIGQLKDAARGFDEKKKEVKKIEGITGIRDDSDKTAYRIAVKCSGNPESIAQQIFAHGKISLQTTISYNQTAIVNKRPVELNLKDCIDIYLEHNKDCLKKELEFDIAKAKDRLEIVEGLLKALASIDDIIALIRGSESSSAAKEALITKYQFTENQAKAILAMRLSSLAKLEGVELENEKTDLIGKLAQWNDTLNSEELQLAVIKTRLEAIVKKYGDKRRTELTHIEIKKEEKEIEAVVPEDVMVVMSQSGNVKRIPLASYKVQKRNGKGVKNLDEATLALVSTNTVNALMVFTDKGKMYRLLVDSIPEGTNASKGVNVASILKMDADEKVIAASSLYRNTKAKYAVFFTKNGLIKKTSLEEYASVKKTTGIIAIKFKEGDSLADVTFLDDEDVVVITRAGMAIHFETKSIGATGRATSGVKAINLNEGDEVVTGLPVHKVDDQIAIVTTNGLGKLLSQKDIPSQGRGGKGVKIASNDIVGAEMVSAEDQLLIMGRPNSICINAKDMPAVGKIAQGNIVINGSKPYKVCKL